MTTSTNPIFTIIIFFFTPYIQMSNICFYEELIDTNKVEEGTLNNDCENPINQSDDSISLI